MSFMSTQHHQLSPVWQSSARSGTSRPRLERPFCLSVMSSDRRTPMWTGWQMGNWSSRHCSTVRCTSMEESAACCSTLSTRTTAGHTCASSARLRVRLENKYHYVWCQINVLIALSASSATYELKCLLFRGSDIVWQTQSHPFDWTSLHP